MNQTISSHDVRCLTLLSVDCSATGNPALTYPFFFTIRATAFIKVFHKRAYNTSVVFVGSQSLTLWEVQQCQCHTFVGKLILWAGGDKMTKPSNL